MKRLVLYALCLSCLLTSHNGLSEDTLSTQQDSYTSRAASLALGGTSGFITLFTQAELTGLLNKTIWRIVKKTNTSSCFYATSSRLQFACGALHEKGARSASASVAQYAYPNMQPHLFRVGYNLLRAGCIGYTLLANTLSSRPIDLDFVASDVGSFFATTARFTMVEYENGRWYVCGEDVSNLLSRRQ